MGSGEERKEVRNNLARPMSDYGLRAAQALDTLVPGPHRDKAVARLFRCSVRMAQYLRRGEYWTADRLSQASRTLGAAFDVLLYDPDAMAAEIAELRRRIDILHERFGGME